MNAKTRNSLLAAGIVILAVALFVVLNPRGDEDPVAANTASPSAEGTTGATDESPVKPEKPKPPTVPKIVIQGGQPVGGVLKIDSKEGDRIKFMVDSDVTEEIHVHGFDVSKEVEAGQTVTIAFDAEFTGIFEAELENSAVPIAEIQVNP